VSKATRRADIIKQLKKRGLDKQSIKALVGNLEGENDSFEPNRKQSGGPAFGIAQWEGKSLKTQVDFLVDEFQQKVSPSITGFSDSQVGGKRQSDTFAAVEGESLDDLSFRMTQNFFRPGASNTANKKDGRDRTSRTASEQSRMDKANDVSEEVEALFNGEEFTPSSFENINIQGLLDNLTTFGSQLGKAVQGNLND